MIVNNILINLNNVKIFEYLINNSIKMLLKINSFYFENNKLYKSKNNSCSIMIINNLIMYEKITVEKCCFAWFGYDIKDVGIYNLKFNIMSNKDIIDFNFIKLHKPIKLYNTPNITANIKTSVSIIIDINELDDELLFIFDDFDEDIKIEFDNIEIKNLMHFVFFLDLREFILKIQKIYLCLHINI